MYNKDMKKLVDGLHIESRRKYSLEDVANLKLIPWATNYRTLIKIFRDGQMGWNINNKGLVVTGNKRREYSITGEAIKRYIINYGPALMSMVRKIKHDKRSTRKSKNRITNQTQ